MTLIGIAAVAQNGAIGRQGEIPWHYPEDFAFFKKTTLHSAVLMGLTTFHDVGILKNRLNVVLSFEPFAHEGIINVTSISSVIRLSRYLKNPIFICGGASVYKAFIPHLDYWWVTHIPLEPDDCDAFMPNGYRDGFHPVHEIRLTEELTAVLYSRGKDTAYSDAVING